MQQLNITIGHKVGKTEKWTIGDICAAFEMVTGCEAYTAIPCFGMWKGQAEASTRIEVVTDSPERIASKVPELADLLDQEAIMVQNVQAVAQFVEAAKAVQVA